MGGLDRVVTIFYKNVLQRTSTFVLFIGVSVLFADRAIDVAANTIFDKINEGKQFKDVRKRLKLDAPTK